MGEKEKLDILVIGSGGREHALAWKLSQSPRAGKLYIAPGNGGTELVGTNVPIKADDIAGLVQFAVEQKIDLVVVGPDDVLAAGAVDAFARAGIAAFGPRKNAAQIEASKPFAKRIMAENNVPTAAFATFTDPEAAHTYIATGSLPLVVKAGGLALGKGVVICQTADEAHAAVDDIMSEKIFGSAGQEIVIEEFLQGQEVSLHALCAGESFALFPSSQDHKQVNDGDTGPNTGGMGTIAPVPWFGSEKVESTAEHVVRPVLRAMNKQNIPFTGLLYPGVMVTPGGSKVLEYNARFGDPETQVYMRLLKSDLVEVLLSILGGTVPALEWHEGAAVCVVAASGGYPGTYETGKEITGLEAAGNMQDIEIFHAGTRKEDGQTVTSGGRVLGVTALGKDVEDARRKAYAALEHITFEGMHYRTDIGLRKPPTY